MSRVVRSIAAFAALFPPAAAPALALADPAAGAATAPAAAASTPEAYEPIVHLDWREMRFEAPVLLASRFEAATQYRVDADGAELDDRALHSQVRIGARFDSKMALIPFLFLAEYEHDLLTGYAFGRPELGGVGLPNHDPATTELRKLWGRTSLGPYLHLGGGFMTSHWGLGLVANDGAHGWTPGSARFVEPFGGDRVLRGFVATGPLTDEKVFASIAFDKVVDDDVLLEGDTATQVVAALIIGRNQPKWAGVYAVHRVQDTPRGRRTEVDVVDFAGSARFELGAGAGSLTFEGEVVLIAGSSELAGSPDYPERDVSQQGLALRAAWDAGPAGAVLDFVHASGDGNLDDGAQRGFKADPNYSVGLLLFQHLLAAHTGRATFSASNPELVGVPPEDVERFPTRGSIANTTAFAARGFWRPLEPLEVYGGPVFAFADAAVADPFRTRVAGGVPRNALDGSPGNYLGTELDAGARYRMLIEGTELTAGVEVGLLLPGDAFRAADGGNMRTLFGGRAMVSYRL